MAKAAAPDATAVCEADRKQLRRLARRIDRAKRSLDDLYAERNTIWARRLAAGDVKKADLARDSEVTPMTITFALERHESGS